MFRIHLYPVGKKENSTLIPSSSSRLAVDGTLKEPCSIMNPVVKIEPLANNASPHIYTCAYIDLFARYYFIEDWVWADGLWEAHMKEDVLATYKTQIGNQSLYILRTDSDTTNFNGAISDSAYPATTDFSITQVNFTNPFTPPGEIQNGTYVVGIINGEVSNNTGAVSYYAMTPAVFGGFKHMLFGQPALETMGLGELIDNVWTWTETDVTENLFKTMYNPYQYIASCMWYPIRYADIAGQTQSTVPLGWWEFNLTVKRMTQKTASFNDSVEMMPVHPQSTRGKYLNYAPYTKYTLYGKFGSLPIDTSYLEIGSYLVNMYSVDYATGQCLFQVFVSDNSLGTDRKLIAKTEFLLGVPIQLAQIGRDYLGMAVNAIDAGKSTMTGALLGGAVAGTAGAVVGALATGGRDIYNTIDSAMPQLQTSGINGSFITTELSTILIAIHYVIVDEDIHHKGRPLCEIRQISTLSGFILCADGDISISCFDEERNEIKRFLTTGFFWE